MDGIAIAGLSMENDLLRLNSISQNLANVLTAGYKREISVSRGFDRIMTQGAPQAAALSSTLGISTAPVTIDASTGTLRATRNPSDVAIDGLGFFEIATDSGVAYTRQGAFQVDTRGRLSNSQGLPVMGLSGELFLTAGPFTIDGNGKIEQDGRSVGQLKLVQFSNPHAMTSIGSSMFAQGAAQVTDTAVAANVRSGYLENSNVNSPQEMIRLTETVRHFESMQKLMQGYDDAFQKTISKLGEF